MSTSLVRFLALICLSSALADLVLVSVPVPVPAPFPLPSPLPFGVPSFASTVVLAPDPVAVSDPVPDFDLALDPVYSFPFLGTGYFLGMIHVYRPSLFVWECLCVCLLSCT